MNQNNKEKEIFLLLLKAVVNEKSLCEDDIGDLQITPEQWHKVCAMAKFHNVFPLVFEKASEVKAFSQLPEYPEYMTQAMSIIAVQVRKTEKFFDLYRSFIKANVYPLVMKGVICRHLYGNYKDHRPSADEDILIKKSDFECVRMILLQEGFVSEEEKIYTETQLEALQEVTFYNKDSGLSIEVHTNPIGREDNWHRKANDYFKDVFENYQKIVVDGVAFSVMAHTENLLFLVIHTLKHFIIGGVGIRQIMDILLYLRQYGEKCNFACLNEALKELKADIFFSDLIHIGNRYLGFDLYAPLEANCPEHLLNDILDSGIFGNSNEVKKNASAWISAALEKNRNGKSNKFKEIVYMVFPPRWWMVKANPELTEKPWLLPASWLQRWRRIIKRNQSDGKNLILESQKLGKQRIDLLKKYRIL